MILLNLSFKWRFDNKGIGSDQNLLKRKIKEALKSTEGRAIIESLTSSGNADALRVKREFFNEDLVNGTYTFNPQKVDSFIDANFNKIFQY